MSVDETSSGSEGGGQSETTRWMSPAHSLLPHRRSHPSASFLRPQQYRMASSDSHGRSNYGSANDRLVLQPSQPGEQTMQEFMRGDSEPLSRSTSDAHAQRHRQSMAAMDRKRRLTNSGHDGGRRRNNDGNGFHDRSSSGPEARLDGPSSPNTPRWPDRESSVHLGPEVIDLTGSSPVAVPSEPPRPPSHPHHVRHVERSETHASSRHSSQSSRRYIVPEWQPDSEAKDCPICGRTFGFLFRRHHCRKCGRVVCSECSPHRITLPRSMIVYPPGTEMALSPTRLAAPRTADTVDLTGDGTDPSSRRFSQSSSVHLPRYELDGGAKVRLCNPCVPDPQPNPQDQVDITRPRFEEPSPRNDLHPSTADFPTAPSTFLNPPNRFNNFSPPSERHSSLPSHDGFDENRQSLPPLQRYYGARLPESGNRRGEQPSSFEDTFSRLTRMVGVGSSYSSRDPPMTVGQGSPPPASSISNHPYPHHSTHLRYQSLDAGRRYYPPPAPRPRIRSMLEMDPNNPQMLSQLQQPSSSSHPPRPRLRESDICPICRRLLPPRGADGDETARETHIMECINARDPSVAQSRGLQSQEITSGVSAPAQQPMHMVTFAATEKDCLGEDGNSQECSICMVEYDVGDQLARLECLCKFHKECIVQWLHRKQECPLHKIA